MITVPLVYNQPIAHGCWHVESSTNLVDWQVMTNTEIVMWPDGINCSVVIHTTQQHESFRIVGKPAL